MQHGLSWNSIGSAKVKVKVKVKVTIRLTVSQSVSQPACLGVGPQIHDQILVSEWAVTVLSLLGVFVSIDLISTAGLCLISLSCECLLRGLKVTEVSQRRMTRSLRRLVQARYSQFGLVQFEIFKLLRLDIYDRKYSPSQNFPPGVVRC
jgi:hypothetical protein